MERKEPDKQQKGKELLTERELETLTALAREIVREAGLAPDPEREAKLEGNKLEAEAAKTQVLLSSGLLVGMAAVAGVLPTLNRLAWLFAAFILVFVSVLAGIEHMQAVAREVASQRRIRRPPYWMPLFNLAVGLFAFMLFLFANLPRPGQLTTPELVRSVSLAALITAVIYGGGWLICALERSRIEAWRGRRYI